MPVHPPFTAEELAAAARAPSTKRGYAADWRDFAGWCQANGETPLPAIPTAIGRYLAERAATLKPATLKRRLAAVIVTHRHAGVPLDGRTPAIADVMAGIRRRLGTAPVQKDAFSLDDLRVLATAQPPTLAGLRDRALILLGFAGAFRRSELAALDVRDLAWTSEGLIVTVRRAKEDQEGQGLLKAIPFAADEALCPVRAVRRWILAGGLSDGPLFRPVDAHQNLKSGGLSGAACAKIVKRAVALTGRRQGWSQAAIAAKVAAVGGHSLRASFITVAAHSGVPEHAIQRHTGHRQVSTLRGYIRRGEMFETSPLSGIAGWTKEADRR